jgi:hypothetical protein
MELLILSIILIVSIYLSIHYHEHLFCSWKERAWITIIIFAVMMSWEFISKANSFWVYPGHGMVGLKLWGWPIEVWLFYLILPYFCFVMYEIIRLKFEKAQKKKRK